MFIFARIKKYLLLVGLLAVGFGLWKYYTHTQETIRVYAENAAKAEMGTSKKMSQTIKDLEQVQQQFNQEFQKNLKATDVV